MQRIGTGCMNPPELVSMQPGLLVAELTLSGVGIVIRKRQNTRRCDLCKRCKKMDERGTPYTEWCRKEEVGARGAHLVTARWRSICWMAGSREDAR